MSFPIHKVKSHGSRNAIAKVSLRCCLSYLERSRKGVSEFGVLEDLRVGRGEGGRPGEVEFV